MQTNIERYKVILLAFLLPIVVTLTALNILRFAINKEYERVTSQLKLIDVISKGDEVEIEKYLNQQGLEYQYFTKGKLKKESTHNLPSIDIIELSFAKSEKVIEATPIENISNILPYVKYIQGRVYLIAVLASKLDSEDYYLVYSQLL